MSDRSRNRRAIFAWCLYDFANSSFTTLVVTFIYATYFTEVMLPGNGGEADTVGATSWWSRAIGLTGVVVALSAPVLGALADRRGWRKRMLLVATGICIVATVALYFPRPGQAMLALGIFLVANIAFELCAVFYNAFLPELAPQRSIGRVSGYGWALGYVGGLGALCVALFGFVGPGDLEPWLPLARDEGQHVRATNLLVAGWFAVFTLPLVFWVRESRKNVREEPADTVAVGAFRRLGRTFRNLRRYRDVFRFLLARLFYNDALITIFSFGGIVAAGTFGFTTEEVITFGIALNVAAGVGAFTLGYLDDWIGARATILLSIVALLAAAVVAAFAESQLAFWIAGLLVGTFSGPNQAASRSLLGRLAPSHKRNEFFGFFAFSGKFTAIIGPLLFGYLVQLFDNQRAGLAIVILELVIGGAILFAVREGSRSRGEASSEGEAAD